MKISLFIPVYNAGEIIKESIDQVVDVIQGIPHDFEIFVVDDGSTDNSGEIVNSINNPIIKYLRYNGDPTRRENLAQSFIHASGEVIVYIDADLATDMGCLEGLIKGMEEYNIVIGSRYLGQTGVDRRLSRYIISWFYNSFIRFYFNSKIRDHNCGFKAFRRDVVLDLVKDCGYDKTLSRGWFWDAEILIRAQKRGYNIGEMPVEWSEARKSTLDVKREMKMIPYILKFKDRLDRLGTAK